MKKYIIPILIIIASVILSIAFYPLLPQSMASHWGPGGAVDGYSDKMFNIIFFPALMLGLMLMFIIIPKIDPKHQNIKMFEDKFNYFICAILAMFLAVQLQVYLWNIGIIIQMNMLMPILMGLLFIVTSVLIKDSKQNYTIGIKTPWTLNSEENWNKTHKLGAKLFMIIGILSILSGIFIPVFSFIVLIGSTLLLLPIVFIYSYIEYRKEKK